MRIEKRPGAEVDGHGVDGEIAAGQIGVDAAIEKGGEVVDVRPFHDAVGAEMLFAPEADDLAAERARAGQRIETGHVDIGRRGAEDQIADGATDDISVDRKVAKAREEAEEVVFDCHPEPAAPR